jgi:uncharacterized membrane protein YhaH (DUF805 family)
MSLPPQLPPPLPPVSPGAGASDAGAPEHGPYSFFDAIKVGFSKYTTFRGRARGTEFWYWALFGQLLSIVLGSWTVIPTTAASVANGQVAGGSQILGSLASLVLFLPTLAVTVRRLHDVNRSGVWLVLPYVLFAGAASLFIVGVASGLTKAKGSSTDDIAALTAIFQANGGWFIGTLILGLLGLLSYIPIIVWLCSDGGPNVPNKFGVRD